MSQPTIERLVPLDTLRVYYQALRTRKKQLWLCLLVPIGGVLMSIVVPFYAGKILAGLAQQQGNLTPAMILLAVFSAVGVLANYIGIKSAFGLQARTMNDLHGKVFKHLTGRSVGFHSNTISGKLISDATDFVNAFGSLMGVGVITALPFLASILIGLVVVLCNSWQLGLFLTIVVLVTLVWAGAESRRRAELRNRRLVATKKLTAHLSDTIVNAPTVKTFAREGLEIQKNARLNTILQNLRIRDWTRATRNANTRIAVLMAMQLCVIILIVYLTRQNPDTLATGIFAFTYTLMLTNRLFEINTITRQVEEAFLQASPMTKMLRDQPEIMDAADATKLQVHQGAITLDNVSFAYDENPDNYVFQTLNLNVKPGEKVGLVGPSGGGKSTLTRLLLRFDDIQDGTITIDGQDIARVTQASLRQNIAYVPQEPLLFHRTVRENIAYGKPDATDEELYEAAKKANAHEFIQALPSGYDTMVGERGVKLSGGQRQRVAIARAILKDAPILILDEATSALDSESEVLIQKSLTELMKGRTTLVIAHRLSTIQQMNRIVVLTDGNILEEGTHKQLLAKKGTYATLWAHQSGGFIEE
jgi:ATP-binding cassette subfamily B protein